MKVINHLKTSDSMRQCFILLTTTLLGLTSATAQELRINEVMALNVQTLLDEDGDSPDWIEIHNTGSVPIDLNGYSLSDHNSIEDPWIFPSFILEPNEYLLVFASDKNRFEIPFFGETVVDVGDEWRYIIPESEPSANWRMAGFDDSAWLAGKTSIGYGDGDDSATVGEGTISIFLRKSFEIISAYQILECFLHVDYDDGFIAYLNGVEIARSGLSGEIPAFDALASSHEAVMYLGGQPEAFTVSNIQDLIHEGENVLSVQVHNTGASSSDMTIIPILSFGSDVDRGGEPSAYIASSTAIFHTNFKISSSGDSIFLSNAALTVIDTLITGVMPADISVGLTLDGSDDVVYFKEPTPGEPNGTNGYATSDASGEVIFSEPAGLYNGPKQISMSSENTDDNIYYTLDGSVPLSTSLQYTDVITLSSNTVIRARVINENVLPGKTSSASYLFNLEHDLPVVSIAADPYEFFDENVGMYMLGPNASSESPNFGANFWQKDWERPVYVEMFEKDGTLAFSANAGARIFGAWSRAWAQKSLSLFFRESYGDGPIKYQVFPEKDLKEFSSLILRNSGNDWKSSMMRDGLLSTFFHESIDTQGFRPAVVYINGQYWGIHNIREKINEDFLAYNHGVDRDSVQILEYAGDPVVGSAEHYVNLYNYVYENDLSITANYEYVQTQMDILNYAYYVSTNVFINNYDWPASNIKFWREDNEKGKWRWIAFDKDAGFGIWDGESYWENRLSYMFDIGSWPNPESATLLFRKLVQNESFKNLFINIYADQLNSSWRPSVIHAEIDAKKGLIESEMTNHVNRWKDDLNLQDWNERVNSLYDYATNRPAFAFDHIVEEFNLSGTFDLNLEVSGSDHGEIRINSIQPYAYPWEGTYLNNVPVEIEAIPQPGYRFLRWEGSESGSNALIKLTTTTNVNLKAIFEDTGSDINQLLINEINYNSSMESEIEDWVELYNKSSDALDISKWVLKDDDDTHGFEFPEGSIIEGEGYLVVCRNTQNFTEKYPQVSTYIGEMDFGLGSAGDCVRLFDDQGALAKEVCYEGVSPWPAEANGQGATLALRDPGLNSKDPSSWYALGGNGNPGEENYLEIPLEASLFIVQRLVNFPNPFNKETEIHYILDQPGHVDLSVFDLLGRRVSKLDEGKRTSGTHVVRWNPSNSIQSGIYLIILESPDGFFVGRINLRK